MATPTQPSDTRDDPSAPLEESRESPTTATSDRPPHLKPHEANALKTYVDGYSKRLRSKAELLKGQQEILELQVQQEKEAFKIRQEYLKSRQRDYELHEQATPSRVHSARLRAWQGFLPIKRLGEPEALGTIQTTGWRRSASNSRVGK